MPLSDFYVLTSFASFGNQASNNVFTYRITAPVFAEIDGIAPLLDAFEIAMFTFPGIDGLDSTAFSPGINYTGAEAYSLTDPTAFGSVSYNHVGAGSGDTNPSFSAYPFRTTRKSRSIRRGQKRFGGTLEGAQSGNAISGTLLANLNGLATNLGTFISSSIGGGHTFDPVVIKRVKYTTPKGTTAYRFPETDAELDFFIADSWELVPFMSTQNSRKRGRGI